MYMIIELRYSHYLALFAFSRSHHTSALVLATFQSINQDAHSHETVIITHYARSPHSRFSRLCVCLDACFGGHKVCSAGRIVVVTSPLWM